MIREKIKAFLLKQGSFDPGSGFNDSQDLFATGVLDSLNFVDLLQFISKEFQIRFKQSDLLFENFETVEKIELMIQKMVVSK